MSVQRNVNGATDFDNNVSVTITYTEKARLISVRINCGQRMIAIVNEWHEVVV
jgi:hypothetical protein